MTRPTRQRERSRSQEGEAETETETEDEDTQICPECSSESVVKSADRGELICEDCGLVIEEDQIDPGPEWRAFNHSERQSKSRVGA
ncbi:transcription initiation factor IIB 3, partial [Haloglomus irregulare]